MKKKLLSLAIAATFCMPMMHHMASSAAEETEFFTHGPMTCAFLEDGTIAITDCDTAVTSVEIPAEIDGVPVTVIASSGFYWCDKLTSVSIPDSIQYIGQSAFYHCNALTEIDFGKGVQYIDGSAFYCCESLPSVTIPGNVQFIGDSAFYGCPKLETVVMEEGVRYIDDDAFMRCKALTKVEFADTVECIDEFAFYECTALEEVTLPAGLLELGDVAFYGCTSLTTVTMQENLLSMGNQVFKDCTALTNVNIPESVISIGNEAFVHTPIIEEPVQGPVIHDGWVIGYNGRAINENSTLVLPDSVKGIADYALYGEEFHTLDTGSGLLYIGNFGIGRGYNLKELTLSDKLLTIGEGGLEGSEKLENIELPDSVVSVGRRAFHKTAFFESQPDGVVYLNDWAVGYKGEMPENGAVSIREGVYGIADSVFAGQTALSSITFSEGLRVIEDKAFKECTALTQIKLPDSLESIGNEAFLNCPALKSVTAGYHISFMGDYCLGYTFDTYKYQYIPVEGFTVSGYDGSLAEYYAQENGFEFISLGDAVYYVLGDVNSDGSVTVTDAVLLQKYLLAQEPLNALQSLSADVTQDGAVNAFDLAALKKHLLA